MGAEGHLLKLLRARNLDADRLEEVLRDPQARRFHAVRAALVAHPRTPRREALSLVSTLYWRGLALVSSDARVHPEVRRAADRDLLRRMPEMAVAERVDLARIVGRGCMLILRLDQDPRVLAALLENRFATEPDVVVAAANPHAAPEILETIAGHPRWSLRPYVRSALLRNPGLPPPLALSLVTRASLEDLEGLRESPGASLLLKACVERVLAQRPRRG